MLEIVVLGTSLVPDVARLIVVKSDTVERAKQLGEVVLQVHMGTLRERNHVLEFRVCDSGQVLLVFQDDHGGAIGEHGRNAERDDAGLEDGEDVGQLCVLWHASGGVGVHDIDLHVFSGGAHL